jgi:prephenate dehydratase
VVAFTDRTFSIYANISKQTMKTIAYQGEPGANSDLACRSLFTHATPLPCPTFEEAFLAVQEGRAEAGLIPIENSQAGRVTDSHHLLPLSGLSITAEHFVPIRHQLMGLKGAKLQNIKEVHSHVQALGQCRRALHRLNLQPVVASDTAGAARMVAEKGDPSVAAIASTLAAELYGLDILLADIEDANNNTTRFVVLAPTASAAAYDQTQNYITSFVFRVKNMPSALYKALGGFATNGVNLLKLESYMLDGVFFSTQFYVEIEGHPEIPSVQRAFEELNFFSRELRLLGAYKAHPFRKAA